MAAGADIKADVVDLLTAVELSGSEAAVLAYLVDENIVAGPNEAGALIERVRSWATD